MDATPAEVRAAYLALAKLHHPDVSGTSSSATQPPEAATEAAIAAATTFKAISQAYEILKDPERRDKYVQQLPRHMANGVDGGAASLRRRESLAEAELRELVEVGDVDGALARWERAGATLQSLLHIIKVRWRPALAYCLKRAELRSPLSLCRCAPSAKRSRRIFLSC